MLYRQQLREETRVRTQCSRTPDRYRILPLPVTSRKKCQASGRFQGFVSVLHRFCTNSEQMIVF
jgi:hypothetical protein